MTVQILELIIKITVEDEQTETGSTGNSCCHTPDNKRELVEQCVEQVLKCLEQLKER